MSQSNSDGFLGNIWTLLILVSVLMLLLARLCAGEWSVQFVVLSTFPIWGVSVFKLLCKVSDSVFYSACKQVSEGQADSKSKDK